MKLKLQNPLICISFIILFILTGYGQNNFTIKKVDSNLWSQIESQLDKKPKHKSFDFITRLVEQSTVEKPDSLYSLYYHIMIKLEKKFNLPAAIHVGEEMVKIAKQQRSLIHEAETYKNLNRYYDALGYYKISTNYTSKAHGIYEKLGFKKDIIACELRLLSESQYYKDPIKFLDEIKTLQKEAFKIQDDNLNKAINLAIISIAIDAKDYNEAEKNIEIIENLPISNPIKQIEYPQLIYAAKGRADISFAQNDIEKAIYYYKKALFLCKQEPSLWLEIYMLRTLADIEFGEGNIKKSSTYINEALSKPIILDVPELLGEIYELKAKIDESEKNYKAVVADLKQRDYFNNKFKERNGGFNIEASLLQKEKEKLITEKENDELFIRLKETEFKNLLYYLSITLLVGLGFVMAFFFERKRRQALITKNKLIKLHISQLENLDKAKSRFFANVSHELRTPLSLIIAPASTMIKDNNLSVKQKKLLNMVKKNANHLHAMTNNILNLKKLESGSMILENKKTLLYAFFQVQLSQFESLAKQKEIHYSFHIELKNNLYIELDTEKCRQVLYNLLSNAIKFTPVNGNVHVNIKIEKNILHINVKDSGIGLSDDDSQNIFNRFYQTQQNNLVVSGGTGIGLSLCKEYANLFNGEISVISQLGEGSTFCFTFPISYLKENTSTNLRDKLPNHSNQIVKYEKQEHKNTNQSTNNSITKSKPLILLVEDNYDLTEYITLLLSPKYQVITAENGQVALQLIISNVEQLNVDLILTDYMMPIMDGYTLVNKLKAKEETAGIPVIMLTARGEQKDKINALRIGVDDYLIKPFNEEELMVRISNLLKNRFNRETVLNKNNKTPNSDLIIFEEDKDWLETFEQYIQNNIAVDNLNIQFLSSEFAMSESTLLRKLKRITGLTPSKYIQEIRLNHALYLLENKTYSSVSIVATKVGFKGVRTFSRSFRKRYGKLPTDFLNN